MIKINIHPKTNLCGKSWFDKALKNGAFCAVFNHYSNVTHRFYCVIATSLKR